MRIGNAWGSIRGILRESFSFAQIKDIVGASGLPVHEIAHVQQKFRGGASKGQLMDNIDTLMGKSASEDSDRIVVACIEEMISRNASLIPELEVPLNRVGWGVSESGVYPLRLQIDLETRSLPGYAQEGLAKAIRRYRDGDFDGAITSIVGVVDKLTETLYERNHFGNHKSDSYQQRVVKSFRTLEDAYRLPLDEAQVDPDETDRMWNNHRQAVNQSAYVLGAYRRQFADVHGANEVPAAVVQRALDCAVFLVRSITGLL